MKKLKNLCLFVITVFISFYARGEEDILNKYIEKKSMKSLDPSFTQDKKKTLGQSYPNKNKAYFFQIEKRKPILFNITLGPDRNHLTNKFFVSSETHKLKKYSPLLGLKLQYQDIQKPFSNFAIYLGFEYVLFRFNNLELITSYEQEFENYFNIPSDNELFSFLTSKLNLKSSFEVIPSFLLFAEISSKYSWIGNDRLVNAPIKMRDEILQYFNYSYGVLIRN